MRRLFAIAFLCCYICAGLSGQSEPDSAVYHKGITRLNIARTTANYLASANYFDSLASQYPDQWLNYYYSGLSLILAAQKANGIQYRDQLLDKAQAYTTKAFSLNPQEPELHVLQAFLYQVRLQTDPQNRAISLVQKSDASLKKAMAMDSSNPRAYFLQGYNIYYTPPMLKGGPKNALPLFLKAREKFRKFPLTMSYMPDWGKQQNEEMIRMCSSPK